MKKAKLLFKAFLSLWLVYNIFVMMVMPNVGAYFGRVTSSFVTPYANTMGLNAGWNFFSPEPAHPMYLKYAVHFNDDEGNEVKESIFSAFPLPLDEDERNIPNITHKREWALMRYMVIEPKRLKILMGPWLCRQNPGATSVDMEHVIETIPFLDQAVAYKDEAVSDLSKEMKYTRESIRCGAESADEEIL